MSIRPSEYNLISEVRPLRGASVVGERTEVVRGVVLPDLGHQTTTVDEAMRNTADTIANTLTDIELGYLLMLYREGRESGFQGRLNVPILHENRNRPLREAGDDCPVTVSYRIFEVETKEPGKSKIRINIIETRTNESRPHEFKVVVDAGGGEKEYPFKTFSEAVSKVSSLFVVFSI